MKTILYIFLFSLPFSLVAQNDTLIINNNYKWKIGVKGLFEKSNDLSLEGESRKVYNFGIQGVYKIGHSIFSLESGLYYMKRYFEINYKDTLYNIYNNTYPVYGTSLYNLHLPLSLRFDTKFIYLTAGFYVDYLAYTKSYDEIEFKKSFPKTNHFLYGYSFSIGVEKQVSSKLSFYLEIESTANISPLTNNINIILINKGVGVGVNYKLVNK